MNTSAPDSAYSLDHLSDDDLLASTRGLVGRTNQMLAVLLAHLAEVEARGIHRERRCASLYTYCIYELRMPEDMAWRRARAARFVRQFPAVFEAVARGELHLTGLLMLGPHFTDANLVEVLARAKHRTKKEIAQLVRKLDPLPDVPARVEPLGPAPARLVGPAHPPWADFVHSMCPVRELVPGERPSEWVDIEVDGAADGSLATDTTTAAPALPEPDASLDPQRYKVQFTATQEYVDLLEQARDLLSHAVPSRSIEEVHLRAMRALVTELKKRKYAATDKPRSPSPSPSPSPSRAERERRVGSTKASGDSGEVAGKRETDPRQRGRCIPAEVRRAVSARDGERCAYMDATGQRCRETSFLEFHHEETHARGGPPTEENLSLRCRAHNALAAEEDFGHDFMAKKKGAAPPG
jgi:hypothetical protein